MSSWVRNKFSEYQPNKAPAVLMPRDNHLATFGVFNKWKAGKSREMGGEFSWNKVTEAEMRDLSELMFDAANVPQCVRSEYWAEFDKMMKALQKPSTP
jgi:hypothetical protein